MIWWWWAIAGCMPEVTPRIRSAPLPPVDSGLQDDTGGPEGGGHTTAVLATVADDFSVGALATIDLHTWAVSDTLVATSGDPVVTATEGYLVQLNRYNYDTARLYQPPAWNHPLWEISLPDGANPQDAAVCGGTLWISQYGRTEIQQRDLGSGLLVGAVDLADMADGDGLPEAASLEVIGDHLYVALQRLDRDEHWAPEAGMVVAIDCQTSQVTDQWSTGSNPVLQGVVGDRLLLSTGVYGALDGEVVWLDTATGPDETPLLREADLGAEITHVAAVGAQLLVLSVDSEWRYSIGCKDTGTGIYTEVEEVQSYLASLALSSEGHAWIAARGGWSGTEVLGGTLVYDVAACRSLVGADWIPTTLHPFSVTLLP